MPLGAVDRRPARPAAPILLPDSALAACRPGAACAGFPEETRGACHARSQLDSPQAIALEVRSDGRHTEQMPTVEPKSEVQGWRVRAWNDEAVEQRFLKEALIAIGGPEMPDLSDGRGTSRSFGY